VRRLSESNKTCSGRIKDAIATDETLPTRFSAVQTSGIHPLNQRKWAECLGLKSRTYLIIKKLEPDCPEWSRKRDRSGISWRFDSQSKLFYAVIPE